MFYQRFAPSVFTLALVSVYAAPVLAATDASLDPVVVTATRSAQSLSKRLSDITVISRDDIERSGLSTVADLLRLQHSVELSNNGGVESASSIFLRGANAGHTLVLVDGQRIGSSTLGQPNVNAIPVAQIERIEILRGPASSLYGSDAIGGVIHIITRRGEGPPTVNASLGAGRWDSYQATAGVSGSRRNLSYALQAEHSRSKGFSSRTAGTYGAHPDRDGFERSSVNGRFGFELADGHELGISGLYSDKNLEFDEMGEANDHDHQRSSAVTLSSDNRFAERWTSRARIGQTVDESTSHSSLGGHFKTRQAQFSWLNDVRLNDFNSFTLGVERLEEKVRSSAYNASAAAGRDTDSALIVYQFSARPFSLQTNLRYDDNSQYADQTTGAVLLGLQLGQAWRVSGGYSTGFKAPSFNDLYWPGYGRDAIRPETSRNGELGLYYKQAAVSASAVLYRNRLEDLIVYNPECPDADPQYAFGCADNVNRARLEGLSLAYEHRVDNTTLVVNGDWQNPTDEASGKLLARRAKRHGVVALRQHLVDWSIGAELEGSSYRYNNLSNTQRLGGYALLHLTASYDFAPAWRVLARWSNVADKNYELSRGYETPGTSLFLAVQYQGR